MTFWRLIEDPDSYSGAHPTWQDRSRRPISLHLMIQSSQSGAIAEQTIIFSENSLLSPFMGWYVEVTKPCSDSAPRLEFLKTRGGSRNHHDLKFQRKAASWTNEPDFTTLKFFSSPRTKQCQALNQSGQEPEEGEDPIQDKNVIDESQRFVAREACLDDEYYRAALLRAETHFEEQPHLRHVDSFKLQFAEREFTAIKRRSKAQFRQKSICIIMKAHTSLVGTVDVYIRTLLPGEPIPQEAIDAHIRPFVQLTEDSTTLYGYVANLCVAKSARRQGVAKTMLGLSIEHAKANGADHVYVHVDMTNEPARKLYKQMGFQVVEEKDRTCLLCLKT